MIQERIHAGLARARAEGKRLGRPRVEGRAVDRAHAALKDGARYKPKRTTKLMPPLPHLKPHIDDLHAFLNQ